MTSTATHAALGALVRERREERSLSMDGLAGLAGVSRSSIHRLEHGHDIRPTSSKLARVLAAVGIDGGEVRQLLPDDDYARDVVTWLDNRASTQIIADTTATAARVTPATPDLVAIKGDAVARVTATGLVDELAEDLKRSGWLVTRPD